MGLFDFPDPVNETSARVVAGGVVAMTATAIVVNRPWVLVPLAYGFGARLLTGPTLSPLGQLATRVVTPRLPGPHASVPGPPKRLAQGVGLVFSGSALVLSAGFGRRRAARVVLSGLLVAASLEAFAGYCVACRAFPLLMRAGLVPESACESCRDIWSSERSTAA